MYLGNNLCFKLAVPEKARLVARGCPLEQEPAGFFIFMPIGLWRRNRGLPNNPSALYLQDASSREFGFVGIFH